MAVLRAIRRGSDLTIYGDGSAVRDYLDADDLAGAILAVARQRPWRSGTWNVATGIGHSVLDVVRLAAEAAAAKPPRIEFLPPRRVDVQRSVLDPQLFAQDFGWRASIGLRQAIDKLVKEDSSEAG
jgi:UDP-glucose 4-epimerase